MIETDECELTAIYHKKVLLLVFVYMANTSQQQTCDRVLLRMSTEAEHSEIVAYIISDYCEQVSILERGAAHVH